MFNFPRISMNFEKIKHNTSVLVKQCARHGISIFGVTKGTFGDPYVGRAMLAGGCVGLCDSRLDNLEKLREAGIEEDLMLIRPPSLRQARRAVAVADISLVSEQKVLERLSDAAMELGKIHRVILMVEMGDLREGVQTNVLHRYVRHVLDLEGLELYGLGFNCACLCGIMPTHDLLEKFSAIVRAVEDRFGIQLQLISGGNSANLPIIMSSSPDETCDWAEVNSVRVGEGILLGKETVYGKRIPNTYNDAFILEAELIEVQQKQSKPKGQMGNNWTGEAIVFKDKGIMTRGILALGRVDSNVDELECIEDHVTVLGGCSDMTVVEIGDESKAREVGDIVRFIVQDYGALLQSMGAPSVSKVYS